MKKILIIITFIIVLSMSSCGELHEQKVTKEFTSDEFVDSSELYEETTEEQNTFIISDSGIAIFSAKNISKLYVGITLKDASNVMGGSGYDYSSSIYPIRRTWHLDDGSAITMIFGFDDYDGHIDLTEVPNAKCTYAVITKGDETTTLFGSD